MARYGESVLTDSLAETYRAWLRTMNVSADELAAWLETDESASVGTRSVDARWSVGQLSGWQSVDQLAIPVEFWRETEWRHARRTLGYVRRHRAQWPRGPITDSRWRRSLRNWGHDPLWEGRLEVPLEPGNVLLDGQVVGTIDWAEGADSVELVDLQIDPAWQAHGLATATLHELACRSHGLLEVHVDSDVGQRFFEHRGFAALGSDSAWLSRSYRSR